MRSDRRKKINALKLALGQESETIEEKLNDLHCNDYEALLSSTGKGIIFSIFQFKNLSALTLYLGCLKPLDKLHVLNQTDKNGYTPLHILLKKHKGELTERLSLFQLLISNGADITIHSNKKHSALKMLSKIKNPNENFAPSVIRGFLLFDDKYKSEMIERFKHAYITRTGCSFRHTIYVKCAMLLSLQAGTAARIEVEKTLITHLLNKHDVNDKQAFSAENLKNKYTPFTLALLFVNLKTASKIAQDKGDKEKAAELNELVKELSPYSISANNQSSAYSFQRKILLRDKLTKHIKDVENIIEYLNKEDEYSPQRKLLGILLIAALILIYISTLSLLIYYALHCEKEDKKNKDHKDHCVLITTNAGVVGVLGFFFLIPTTFLVWLSNSQIPMLSNIVNRPKLNEEIYRLNEEMREFAKENDQIKTQLQSLKLELTKESTIQSDEFNAHAQTVIDAKISFNNIRNHLKSLRELVNVTDLKNEPVNDESEPDQIVIELPHVSDLHECDIGPSSSDSHNIEMTTYKLISNIDTQEENPTAGASTSTRKKDKGKERISLFATLRESKKSDDSDDEEKPSSSYSP